MQQQQLGQARCSKDSEGVQRQCPLQQQQRAQKTTKLLLQKRSLRALRSTASELSLGGAELALAATAAAGSAGSKAPGMEQPAAAGAGVFGL
jgi:hypothetical protein